MQVLPESKLTLHFEIRLQDGSIVDSNFEKSPVEMTLGDGNMLPGFEKHLLGMEVGNREIYQVNPEDAFGQPNSQNVQRFKRTDFGMDMVLEPGLVISFADAANGELPGVVKELDGDFVSVDFNHPLAGKTLIFEVEVLSISEPTNEN